ncbi:hypothetical protein BST13_05590 [Mycobacterium aquaticum]|uniref:Uncharacterized protein n=1 Tax=Mycobacterium aquaticum TaxID=1927124 RepID=A0A1X0B6X2_9MYCO|nr:hypothetical protein BST13_05590 [Mycobacterium aquaticum]
MKPPVVDQTLDSNLDRVAEVALGLAVKIRDDDPRRLFEELRLLAQRYPAKYAQITMALAAFVNPDEGTVALQERVEAITESRVGRHISAVAS